MGKEYISVNIIKSNIQIKNDLSKFNINKLKNHFYTHI